MIKIDIDMPIDCAYCPILQRYVTFGGGKGNYCGFSKKDIHDMFKRHESCPLIEVKDGEQND